MRKLVSIISFSLPALLFAADPLPSWNHGHTKTTIIEFIQGVIDPESPTYVHPEKRVAVFDADGTLITEDPINFQRSLGLKRLREMAAQDPSLKKKQPFKAAVENDAAYYNQKANHSEVFLEAFKGQTLNFYQNYVQDFIKKETPAEHWNKPFPNLFYQPSIELFKYLEKAGFQVYICSTTEEECLRSIFKEKLNLKPYQVIGNQFEMEPLYGQGKQGFLLKNAFHEPECRDINKCFHIQDSIGRTPIFCFGNSMGDWGMLTMTQADSPHSLVLILNHDDAERELYYPVERLLCEAKRQNWTVASMKKDFKTIYSSQ